MGNGNSPEAKLLRTMVDAFAAYERALIRARTKAALAAKKARGERVGGVPYGYRDVGGKLVEDETEQVVVARARELREEGQSLRAIGRTLLTEGNSPRNAEAWHVQVLARMVCDTPQLSPRYSGWIKTRGSAVDSRAPNWLPSEKPVAQ